MFRPSHLAAVLLALLVAAGCSSSSPADDASSDVDRPRIEDEQDVEEFTPPSPTLPPGYVPPVGEIPSVTVDVAAECADAISPIRGLMDDFVSGLELDADANEILNDSLTDARAACSEKDWYLFQSDELNGWMNAAPSPKAPPAAAPPAAAPADTVDDREAAPADDPAEPGP